MDRQRTHRWADPQGLIHQVTLQEKEILAAISSKEIRSLAPSKEGGKTMETNDLSTLPGSVNQKAQVRPRKTWASAPLISGEYDKRSNPPEDPSVIH